MAMRAQSTHHTQTLPFCYQENLENFSKHFLTLNIFGSCLGPPPPKTLGWTKKCFPKLFNFETWVLGLEHESQKLCQMLNDKASQKQASQVTIFARICTDVLLFGCDFDLHWRAFDAVKISDVRVKNCRRFNGSSATFDVFAGHLICRRISVTFLVFYWSHWLGNKTKSK